MSGVHPPLPSEIPGGLPELIIGLDGHIYPATANTTSVVVAGRRHPRLFSRTHRQRSWRA
ncbi:hypothetical protein HII28_05455 [Planctomonas sp. JC2975]|uniref:hypothetical protein n=1 Tax=Planctomonas sp. JC2975 TaxID=2729626 RepID=UPI0014729BC6|nr:hypothetical protein [Planctomonas sp. JC2975]NNC11323.1 hypothetical protein [Planctomonas sp. JC2975]